MAQRIFQQFINTLEKQTVRLTCQAIGRAGVGAITIRRGKGIASITESGTGLWTIVLQDPYFQLLGVDVFAKANDGATQPTVTGAWLKSETVATPGSQTVVLQMIQAAGTSVSPVATTDIFVELVLSNSTAL